MINDLSRIDTRDWGTPAVLLIGALIAAILVAGYAWQISRSDSNLSEAAAHTEAAVLLQKASIEDDFAAGILGLYVLGGNETMIRRFQNQSSTALARVTSAASMSKSDQVRQVADQNASIVTNAGSAIALRQAGDAQAAVQALPELRTEFQALSVTLQSAVDAELATAVSLTTSSHNAEDTASWLLITGMSTAITTGLGIISAARRSLFRRLARQNLSPA